MGSPYPLSFTVRWPYYLLRPSLRRRGFPGRWPLQHVFAEACGDPVARVVLFGDLLPASQARIPLIHSELRALAAAADLVVANCEGTVGDATGRKRLQLRLGADYVRSWLEALGAEPERCVLSVANNHSGDAGADGFDETWRRLVDLGVTPVGSTEQPVVTVWRGDLSIAIAAWTRWQNCSLDRAATIPTRAAADCLIAFPHWEAEFRHFPRASTRGVAHALLEEGFDLVVGAHPHVVQPLEWWGSGLCAYSLGNLSRHPMRRVRWPLLLGAALEVTIAASGPRRGRVLGYRMHPFVHEVQDGEPRLLPLHAVSPGLRRKVERRVDLLFSAFSPGDGGP